MLLYKTCICTKALCLSRGVDIVNINSIHYTNLIYIYRNLTKPTLLSEPMRSLKLILHIRRRRAHNTIPAVRGLSTGAHAASGGGSKPPVSPHVGLYTLRYRPPLPPAPSPPKILPKIKKIKKKK